MDSRNEADLPAERLADWLNNHPVLGKVINILQAHQIEAYLVGGAVRDLLLGREDMVDLDFAVPDDGLRIARHVANALQAAFYPLDPERGTGRVVYEVSGAVGPAKSYLDFATFRGPTLLADLADRDFTINAMALNLAPACLLVDPLAGRRDLALGQIRAVSATAFNHDPIRVLRAIRQAVEFHFSIEANTAQSLRQAAPDLATVSPERRRDELLKLLNTPNPGQALQMLRRLDVLPHILPEIEPLLGVGQGPPHHLDVFDHTSAALEAWAGLWQAGLPDLPANLKAEAQLYLQEVLAGELTLAALMPLAVLLHDTGKPLTRTQEGGPAARVRFLGHERQSAKIARQLMRRLRFSSQAIGFVEKVVLHHMRPLLLAEEPQLSRRAIYRLFRDTNGGTYQAGVAVALHALADQQATYPPGQGQAEWQALLKVVQTLVRAYFEQRDQVVDPPPLLTGRDLIETLGLAEGPVIGLLLARLKEAQATGKVLDRTAALAFVRADPDFSDPQQAN